jgi:hypothetical protein
MIVRLASAQPTFEHSLAALVKSFRLALATWHLCLDVCSEHAADAVVRPMPLGPLDFSRVI